MKQILFADRVEKEIREEVELLSVKDFHMYRVNCDDDSISIEVYSGIQGHIDSKRLGFSFEPDGTAFYWFIALRKPCFRKHGDIDDNFDVKFLVKEFYE